MDQAETNPVGAGNLPSASGSEPVRPGRKGSVQSTSLAFRLLALVGAVAIPLLLLGIWTLWDDYLVERNHAEARLLEQARGMARLVDREFNRTEVALAVLASSGALPPGELNAGDLTSFGLEMRAAAVALSAGATSPGNEVRIRLLDRGGSLLVDTAQLDGTLARVSEQAVPDAMDAIATGQPRVSGLRFGPVTHNPYIIAIMPVVRPAPAGTGRTIEGAIGASVPRSRLLAIVGESGLAAPAVATILDRTGITVARSAADLETVGRPVRASTLRWELESDSGVVPPAVVTREGYLARVAFAHAPVSGFIVQLNVPEQAFSAPLRAKFVQAMAISGLVLLFTLALALAVARKIVAAFERVPQIVQSAVRSDRSIVPRTGLREADVLADALVRSETELLALNRELELRVEVEVDAREAANARALRAERLQALGQLAGGIAHDINNVLQAIDGAASLIARRPHEQVSVSRHAKLINEAVTRGASVTRRLLAFARQGALQLEPVDTRALLQSVAELLRPALGPRIELRVSVPDQPMPALVTDKGQLETVLVNLANNARDAMPEGGILQMAVSIESVAQERAGTSDLTVGRFVRFDVIDTGSGMDKATLARVLEPFFTTKPMDKGTGLGLSMAKGFAEQSGGNLVIESQEGHGTTVRFWLRLSHEP